MPKKKKTKTLLSVAVVIALIVHRLHVATRDIASFVLSTSSLSSSSSRETSSSFVQKATYFQKNNETNNSSNSIQSINSTAFVRGFGACLLVKDDNEILPEWLAYHYTVLPLRYIVVGTDEGNSQDPNLILKKYNEYNLQYWTLNASDFANRHGVYQPDVTRDETFQYHRGLVHRQNGFITACSELLKQQGVHWTVFIDTDEFLVMNRLPLVGVGNASSDGKDSVSNITSNRSLYELRRTMLPPVESNATVLEVIQQLQQQSGHPFFKSCYTMPRVTVGALETRFCPNANATHEMARRLYDLSIYKTLRTLRFVQHAKKGDFETNRFGKVFMDLSQVSHETLQKPKNIHRPYKEHCGYAWTHFPDALFYLNHYVGSWEQYSSRRDDRRRDRGAWGRRAFLDDDMSCEQAIHLWLERFVQQVGGNTSKAKELLGV